MEATVYKHEPALFAISLIISLVVWLVLVLGTFGIALIYVLFFYIFYLFVQSAFISRIKGTAVRITPEQFPDLNARIEKCCTKLQMKRVPEAYLMHGNGVFNAFATRFLGRDFIVLYSDVVDALENDPDAVDFYIGHELGHLHRKHIQWGWVLWPAAILPLLGAAYSRAREYTCDLYGLACCNNRQSAVHGLAALAAGQKRWQSMNAQQYTEQARQTGGFWMSFHELIGDYPWLVKRIAAVRTGEKPTEFPSRNPLAWLFALFVPRLGTGGGLASMLVVVAIIGILAAIALPAYQDYTTRAKISEAIIHGRQATQAVEDYINKNGRIPPQLEDAGISSTPQSKFVTAISVNSKNAIVQVVLGFSPVEGKSVLFVPSRKPDKSISWRCASEDVPAKYLPAACR
jgi:Zn-dependent protease with chaperone function/type II secretory pathway pseudopilin PulG